MSNTLSSQSVLARFWKRCFKFSGRATRSEWWWGFLFYSLSTLAYMADRYFQLCFLNGDFFREFCLYDLDIPHEDFYLLLNLAHSLCPPIYLLFWGALVAFVSLSVRRLHDAGFSGFCFVITFIPILNIFAWYIIATTDSIKGKNRYGDSEKYPDEITPKKADITPAPKTLETTVPMNSAKAKFCLHCGNKILEDSAFCSCCGGKQPNT